MSRVIWMVIDSVGIGALPDSQKFGDVNVDTLPYLYRSVIHQSLVHSQQDSEAWLC